MEEKLTRLTYKMATQLHLVAESCTICISRSRCPVRKLLDMPSYETYEDSYRCAKCLHVSVPIQL
jgi:hypothetical protein